MTVKELKNFLEIFEDDLNVWIDTQGAYYEITSVGSFLDESTNKNSPHISCETIYLR